MHYTSNDIVAKKQEPRTASTLGRSTSGNLVGEEGDFGILENRICDVEHAIKYTKKNYFGRTCAYNEFQSIPKPNLEVNTH